MRADKKRLLWFFALFLLFGTGIVAGYIIVSERSSARKAEQSLPQSAAIEADDSSFVRIFYPSEDRLLMEERRVKRPPEASIADLTVAEFLRGPSNMGKSVIPAGVKLLGAYRGSDGILYVDLSDEFRRNFKGDALTEFLLLKGLYESIISSVEGVDDVKILIEGREIESIGGHLPASYPLKNTLAEAVTGER